MSADKAYSGLSNLRLVVDNGAQPFIPFRKHATGTHWRSYKDKSGLWGRMFHFFKYHEEEFYERYHKRSNSETVFSMIKSKFGERLRSKTRTAQVNELLLKMLCHKLCESGVEKADEQRVDKMVLWKLNLSNSTCSSAASTIRNPS